MALLTVRSGALVLGLLALLATLGLAGCIGTRIVRIDHLTAQPAPARPAAQWKREVDDGLQRYSQAPVLAPGDDRIEPIFGGISTLVYFGDDLAQKLRDQQVPAHWRSAGGKPAGTLGELCAQAPSAATASPVRHLPLTPLWVPTSTFGEPLPADASCSVDGAPAAPAHYFCMRVLAALQPSSVSDLILVVHGLFDSSEQGYVQRIGETLYARGYSVALADMRDHGDTFRAAPWLPTSLGAFEGADILQLAAAFKTSCGPRIARMGAVGVSGGGLDVIQAFAKDEPAAHAGHPLLDAGVLALSPLLSVDDAIEDVGSEHACLLTRAVELTWREHVLLTLAGGAIVAGGAATAQGLAGSKLDANVAVAGAIGAGVSLLASLAADAWLDGSSDKGCISTASIGEMFRDLLHERWKTLTALQETDSAPSLHLDKIPVAQVTLERYIRVRAEGFYASSGHAITRASPATLAAELRAKAAAQPTQPTTTRLLIIGAGDDPVTRAPAFEQFSELTASLPNVHAALVDHGGHGAMWVVQPALFEHVIARFFEAPASPLPVAASARTIP